MTTTNRVDVPDAAATECDDPGSPAVVVDETTTVLDPTVATILTTGPADIFVGPDQLTPFHVASGSSNFDTLTTYETVVTQYFQATAPGPPCEVAVEPRFTG